MSARRLARIGKVADQFKCDDGADSRPSSAQAAYRSNGIARIEVGRQHVCNRRKRGVGERGEPEQHRDEVQIHRENCWDEKQYADAAKYNQRFSRATERPSTTNQVPGNATAKKIAQIRRKKKKPHSQQSALERNSLCDQVDGKPVRDEKPNGIGKDSGDEHSPGL